MASSVALWNLLLALESCQHLLEDILTEWIKDCSIHGSDYYKLTL